MSVGVKAFYSIDNHNYYVKVTLLYSFFYRGDLSTGIIKESLDL